MNARWAIDQRRGIEKAPSTKARSSGYLNAPAKDATVPQIAAQSPSDRSEIRIKDAPVSGQS